MSGEIRFNFLKDCKIIFAPKREKRPRYLKKSKERGVEKSPFVYGNEKNTPKEIFSIREYGKENEPGWLVRVIPNLYPVLQNSQKIKKEDLCLEYRYQNYGYHEIVIETPDPKKRFFEFSVDEVERVLFSYQKRVEDIYKDSKIEYINIFKNSKADAGASIYHEHSQIIATPYLPKNIEIELNQIEKYFEIEKGCFICDEIECEIEKNERVVLLKKSYIVYAPFSSYMPYLLRVAPQKHLNFLEIKDLKDLSHIFLKTLKGMQKMLNFPAYNYILKVHPKDREDFHFYIDIFPRISEFGGFEIESGSFINSIFPEDFAKEIKGYL